MSRPTFIGANNNRSVIGSDPKDHSVNMDYPTPKISPSNGIGLVSYTFTSEPSTGTTELFTIPNIIGRTSIAFVMINETGDFYTPLTEYYTNYFADIQFPPPTFIPQQCEIIQKIVAEIDDTRIRVYYFASRTYDAGYPSPPALETMLGQNFKFKFVMFYEGKDDVDTKTLFTTT